MGIYCRKRALFFDIRQRAGTSERRWRALLRVRNSLRISAISMVSRASLRVRVALVWRVIPGDIYSTECEFIVSLADRRKVCDFRRLVCD